MRYLILYFIFLGMAAVTCHASAEKKVPTLDELRSIIATKEQSAEELKIQLDELDRSMSAQSAEKIAINAEIGKQESQVKRLQEYAVDKNSFDLKNEIIGINYEIRTNRKKLAELNELLAHGEKTRTRYNAQMASLTEELKLLELRKLVLVQKKAIKDAKKSSVVQKKRETAAKSPVMAVDKPVSQGSVSERNASSKEKEIAREQARLLKAAESMRPAAAALNRAKAKALAQLTQPPILGEQVEFFGAIPPGSQSESLGIMTHLGNNQYVIEISARKGKNEYIAGDFHFFKSIPSHYDGVRCLILIDLQNQEQPNFQLFVMD